MPDHPSGKPDSGDEGSGEPASRDRLTIRAHAKINLALAVGSPLPAGPNAGMHPIASWMAPIDLADSVEVVRTRSDEPPAGSDAHTITHADGAPVDWPIDSDLAVRAHRALQSTVGRPLPARIAVRKSIPAGGGLGGGSSDAAAVLRALNHLFDLCLDAPALRAVAATLGSDIPYFIPDAPHPDTPLAAALVTGLGETIEPAPISAPISAPASVSPSVQSPAPAAGIPLTLIAPPFGCPTGSVYRAFDEFRPADAPFRDAEVGAMARAGLVRSADLFNDLAEPAVRVRPELGTLRDRLAADLGVPVHVSGSGSTLFVLGEGPGALPDASAITPHLPRGTVAIGTRVLCSFS